MSAVPPNHGVDRDWPVHHRGTGAHDEQFSEAEQHGRGGYVGGHHDRNWASSYQPGSVDAANFLLASALSGLWLQERVRVTNFARLSPVRPEVSANAPCWHAISTRSSAFPGARSGGRSQGRRIRRYTPMPSAVSPHAKTSLGRRVFFACSPSPTWDERARDSRARRIAIVRTANPSLGGTRPSS
jgi:hypothetical protein